MKVNCFLPLLLSVSYCTLADDSALTLKAGESICKLSKRLKSVFKYVDRRTDIALEKISDLEDMLEVVKFKIVKGRSNNTNRECKDVSDFIMSKATWLIRKGRKEVDRLKYVGLAAIGNAGLAAGRLDEMVNVWRRVYSAGTGNFCIGDEGNETKRTALPDCYLTDSERDDFTGIDEGDRLEDINNVTADAFNELLELHTEDDLWSSPLTSGMDGKDCRLTNARSGGGYLVGESPSGNLFWGDGVLGVKRGSRGYDGRTSNVRSKLLINDVVWEADTVEHTPIIRNVHEDLQNFFIDAEKIDELVGETGDKWNWEFSHEIGSHSGHPSEFDDEETDDVADNTSAVEEAVGKAFVGLGNREAFQEEMVLEEMALCGECKIYTYYQLFFLVFVPVFV
ncbi:procyclin-associated gene 1 (PAG1) protein, putative [Trypanosoma equiperdum]|uniref:Procyclin-associated gene 1 (PAG1) protein, putative n=1 Tax=Trypanosoma equiperdum TaxID=5694 RepID=A0A1G4IGS8_TRYEQ|nr:procyclin-associated gene 1 (PAG1) protein, putative [Trypanosoma equiperdum]